MAFTLAKIPLTPDQLGPEPPDVAPLPQAAMPQMPTQQPTVTGPTPLDLLEQNKQAKLQKLQWADQHPWGTAENHPGVGGKIAHVLSVAGNIAGDIFAPATMANIPGTQLNRQEQEAGLGKGIEGIEKQQSEQGLEGAQAKNATATAAHTAAETPEVAPNAESTRAYQGAETQKIDDDLAQGPTMSRTLDYYVNKAIKENRDPATDPLVQHIEDSITAIQPQRAQKGMEKVDLVGPGGKPIAANYDPLKGIYTDASGKVIPNPQPYEKPNQAGMVTMIVPDPSNPGGGIVQRLGAGSKVAPGAQTAAGVNSMNTPTTNQRTAAGRADTVLAMVPEVESRIDALSPKIGPIAGRWNEFMQGKVGSDDPDFAALRSDLLMMSSAVALAHAQGRLPENLREEFDHAINAPHQTPQNLKATIQTMVPWLQKVKDQGGRPGAESAPAANEPKVLKFNAATGRLE